MINFEELDETSGRLDAVIERRYQDFKKTMDDAWRAALEHKEFSAMKEQLARDGMTPEDYLAKRNDAPLAEGSSSLRCFLAQAGRGEINKAVHRLRAESLRLALRPWFEHGQIQELRLRERMKVLDLALYERAEPLRVYREEQDEGHAGDVRDYDPDALQRVDFDCPRSWSTFEKAMMGEITYVADIRHGTRVSVLSPYPGEAEVIAYAPKGFRVTSIEQRKYGKRPTRLVVHLEELL